MSEWGDRVQARRKSLSMRQAELARRVGVSAASVNDWESGKTQSISGPNLLRLAEALAVPSDWILHGTGPAPEAPAQPEPTVAETAGQNVRSLRRQLGLTQAELAHRAGVSQAMVANIEAGKGVKLGGTTRELAKALGVKESALYGDPEKLAGPLLDLLADSDRQSESASASSSQSARPDLEKLRAAIEMVESVLEELGIDYPAATKAGIVVAVYAAIDAEGVAAAAKGVVATMLKTVSEAVKT